MLLGLAKATPATVKVAVEDQVTGRSITETGRTRRARSQDSEPIPQRDSGAHALHMKNLLGLDPGVVDLWWTTKSLNRNEGWAGWEGWGGRRWIHDFEDFS